MIQLQLYACSYINGSPEDAQPLGSRMQNRF